MLLGAMPICYLYNERTGAHRLWQYDSRSGWPPLLDTPVAAASLGVEAHLAAGCGRNRNEGDTLVRLTGRCTDIPEAHSMSFLQRTPMSGAHAHAF